MSLKGKRLYKFGAFGFDADENVLRRGAMPVPLTPKMLELLRVLIENHGRIVEKDDLMKQVWVGSFVEEGNLTFTVRQLRKVLEDDAHHPAYIETVPRRGYRFIAEVEEISAGPASENGVAHAAFQTSEIVSLKSNKFLFPIIAAAILLIGTIAISWRYMQNKNLEAAPVLSAQFASEKLSTNGKVPNAVVSPDGKNVVYTNGMHGMQSVWLRQLESANNVEIIPPSDDWYAGLALSPDGNFLYFSRRPHNFDGQADIYRVSIFGGIPTKLIGETQGWMSVSPDGARISFVRCYYRDDEFCSLWIADSADGKNEVKLTSRPRPIRIGANQISPDGTSIAFAFGQSENAANEFSLAEIDIESRADRVLTTEEFFNIKYLTWLPNRIGLLFTASKIPNKHFRIWKLTATTGVAHPLTKDSETYSALSLNKEANILVSTQVKQDFHLFISDIQNPTLSRSLTEATTVAFAPSGKIIFSSSMSGNDEIWSINSDGSGQKQLTNNAADESAPVVSFDGRSIFFASNRTGEVHVWRMNVDGSDQVQITQKEGGFPISVSPDGKWLYYISGLKRTLLRVAVLSGEEQLVLKEGRYRFGISPDGLRVAFSEIQDGERHLTIASLPDGNVIKTFPLADRNARMVEVTWLPSGTGILYVLANTESENNVLWSQRLNGGEPRQIAKLGDEEVWDLALSPDGKTVAVVQGSWKHDAVLISGLK